MPIHGQSVIIIATLNFVSAIEHVSSKNEINLIDLFMQVDYCTEAKMFDENVDISTCKAMSDLKAGIPSDITAETFIKLGMKCAQRLYKKKYVNNQYYM